MLPPTIKSTAFPPTLLTPGQEAQADPAQVTTEQRIVLDKLFPYRGNRQPTNQEAAQVWREHEAELNTAFGFRHKFARALGLHPRSMAKASSYLPRSSTLSVAEQAALDKLFPYRGNRQPTHQEAAQTWLDHEVFLKRTFSSRGQFALALGLHPSTVGAASSHLARSLTLSGAPQAALGLQVSTEIPQAGYSQAGFMIADSAGRAHVAAQMIAPSPPSQGNFSAAADHAAAGETDAAEGMGLIEEMEQIDELAYAWQYSQPAIATGLNDNADTQSLMADMEWVEEHAGQWQYHHDS